MSGKHHTIEQRERLALRIVTRLADSGHRALYVGGYVRDGLLGNCADSDIDIATNARPQDVAALFAHTVGVGATFGVMMVVEDGVPFEVATFRSDIGARDGRHPQSVVYADERSDAHRRDFTINGMFRDPFDGTVLDYVGGRVDLGKHIVRAIGDPAQRFKEDHLRLLRAIRFSARLDFEIERATWQALCDGASAIKGISAERVFQELDRMLRGPAPHRAVKLMLDSGLLREVLPEVATLEGIAQPPQFHPEGDVMVHTLLALSLLEKPSQCLVWGVLLHDIGKPDTMRVADRIRFSNHHTVGADKAQVILQRLRAPKALIEDVCACIANHMNFMNVSHMRLSTLKRFLGRDTIEDEIELHRVDCLSSHGMLDNYELVVRRRSEFAQEQLKPKALLTGQDLIDLGRRPGREFGDILKKAYDLQLEEKLKSREEALEWLRSER